jgi:hypothetical protein
VHDDNAGLFELNRAITAYLGHVIVLWSWALKQPNPETIESATVRFR